MPREALELLLKLVAVVPGLLSWQSSGEKPPCSGLCGIFGCAQLQDLADEAALLMVWMSPSPARLQ